MIKNSSIDIAVAYYKPATIIENECLIPMQVGKILSDTDLEMLGDDTGDHISDKNFFYAELTGIYWLWKNSHAEYKGLFHYRRFLDLNQESLFKNYEEYSLKITSDFNVDNFLETLEINESNIKKILEENFMITRRKGDLRTWSTYTVREHYEEFYIKDHLDIALEVIKKDYPDYIDVAHDILDSTMSYFANIVIMKSKDFDDYCNFLFGILEKVEKQINPYDKRWAPGTINGRWAGFLAERLTAFYITQKQKEGKKIAEFPAVILEPASGERWFECRNDDLELYMPLKEKMEKEENPKQILMENSEQPIVSVIMAAYNSEKTIKKAVESVVNQTLTNIEIIIVDDGSTDRTVTVLEELFHDSRIKILRQENSGLGVSRNSGKAMATGKYIHFMDCDDYMDADYLESMVYNAEKHDSDLVISLHKSVSKEGATLSVSTLPHTLYQGKMSVETHPDLLLTPCHVWDKIFRRDLIEEVFFPKVMNGEDIKFWWEVILKAKSVSVLRNAKFNYVISPNSAQENIRCILGTFQNIEETEKYLFEIQRSDATSILESFFLVKSTLIGHSIYRARKTLSRDKEFRFIFFKNVLKSLISSRNIHNEIAKKKDFFYTDFNLIEKLNPNMNLQEFERLIECNVDELFWKYLRYRILSKLLVGKSRKRYKVKKKNLERKIKSMKS